MLIGTAAAYPAIQDALAPAPVGFGEVQPPLRPTVTPLPANNQPATEATPADLPETPLLAPNQPLPYVPAVTPDIADTSASIPTRLVIPAINLDAPVETVDWSQVNGVSVWNIPSHFAAGWLKTSAPPGRPGNTVLDGHHNIAGQVFRYLMNLKTGDLIEVHRRNALWIQPTSDERLTLVTCWPYTDNTHRLIVVAKPLATN